MKSAAHNNCLDEIARLNRYTVSIGLLERIAEHMERDTYAPFGEPCGPIHAERQELTRELRATLEGMDKT